MNSNKLLGALAALSLISAGASAATLTPTQIGTTPAAVHANFAYVQMANFQANPNLDATITAMPAAVLKVLAQQIDAETAGNPGLQFYTIASLVQRLGAANLQRLAAVFEPGKIAAYVAMLSSPEVQGQFGGPSLNVVNHAAPVPGAPVLAPVGGLLGMSPYEIYLDFYTVGGVTEASAFAQAFSFCTAWLTGAWYAGNAAGNLISSLSSWLAPNATTALSDAIGSGIDGIIASPFGNGTIVPADGIGSGGGDPNRLFDTPMDQP
jgi:hypothetical protein